MQEWGKISIYSKNSVEDWRCFLINTVIAVTGSKVKISGIYQSWSQKYTVALKEGETVETKDGKTQLLMLIKPS